jgi:hypothetical protein
VNQDAEHLRLLSIFHYVVAAIGVLFCSFPLIHVVMGLVLVFSPEAFDNNQGEPPPPFLGWMFVAMGGTFVLAGWTFAALVFFAGLSLARRRRYMFCLVMAALECLWAPFGTVLGVFTIVVLMRESVKQLFAAEQSLFAAQMVQGAPRV